MSKNEDLFYSIALKHSKTPIESEAAVDKFYEDLPKNFSAIKVEEILYELTSGLYDTDYVSVPVAEKPYQIEVVNKPLAFLIDEDIQFDRGQIGLVDETQAFFKCLYEILSINRLIGC